MTPSKEVMAVAEIVYDLVKRETSSVEMAGAVLNVVNILLNYDSIAERPVSSAPLHEPGYGI